MSALTDFDLDETGKIDLSAIYDRPDPRDYYQTLVNLDYRIPAEGAPVFRRVIEIERLVRQRRQLKLLDVGCSCGVNAALLKHNRTLPDLFRAYGVAATGALSRRKLLARDCTLFEPRAEAGPRSSAISMRSASTRRPARATAGTMRSCSSPARRTKKRRLPCPASSACRNGP